MKCFQKPFVVFLLAVSLTTIVIVFNLGRIYNGPVPFSPDQLYDQAELLLSEFEDACKLYGKIPCGADGMITFESIAAITSKPTIQVKKLMYFPHRSNRFLELNEPDIFFSGHLKLEDLEPKYDAPIIFASKPIPYLHGYRAIVMGKSSMGCYNFNNREIYDEWFDLFQEYGSSWNNFMEMYKHDKEANGDEKH